MTVWMAMDTIYDGKTVGQWITLLRRGVVAERCAAALALAEIGPKEEPIRSALVRALTDPDVPVQAAAQIAVGLVTVNTENRNKMRHGLLDKDVETRGAILRSLYVLASADFLHETAPGPEEDVIPPVALVPGGQANAVTLPSPTLSDPVGAMAEPDIAIVNVVPWWFLLGEVVFFLVLAWVIREVSWSKWPWLAVAGMAALFLSFAWIRRQRGSISADRFRARARFACPTILASLCALAIVMWFPLTRVLIDNECGADVRLVLDGQEWLAIRSGESKAKALAFGKHQLVTQPIEGKDVLDVQDIEVAGYGPYVLNVLGAQTYFHGHLTYGAPQLPDTRILQDKWFELPRVDYLCRNLPKKVKLYENQHVTLSYFTKGAPPKLIELE